jgi:DNA-binding CsgD family transcriptional regulator
MSPRSSPLSVEARATLDVAATLGVIFDPDLLEAVIGGPIADAVDECLASGMIRPHGDRLSFHHGLAQNVFLDVMSVPRGRELYRRILHVLEENAAFDVNLAHLAIAERLDAKSDAARIVRELRRIGARRIPRGPRPETRANPANLTAREIEVLELLVQGCSNREIADALYLSPRTVGHHVSAILAKLRIATRADAHARVMEHGLLPK